MRRAAARVVPWHDWPDRLDERVLATDRGWTRLHASILRRQMGHE